MMGSIKDRNGMDLTEAEDINIDLRIGDNKDSSRNQGGEN